MREFSWAFSAEMLTSRHIVRQLVIVVHQNDGHDGAGADVFIAHEQQIRQIEQIEHAEHDAGL